MSDVLYLGTSDGLLTLEADGGTARTIEVALAGKHITSVTLAGGVIHATAARDGIYRGTLDEPSFRRTLAADAITLAGHPLNPYVLLCGTEPVAAYHSADAGETWRELDALRRVPDAAQWYHPSPLHRERVTRVLFHPDDLCAYWVAVEVGGVFHSGDCGFHFTARSRHLHPDVHDLAINTEYPVELWAATGGGVYQSRDSGVSWREANTGLLQHYTTHIAFIAGNPPVLLAGTTKGPPRDNRHSAGTVIFRSEDGGQHWQEAMDGLAGPLDGAPGGFAAVAEGGAERIYLPTCSGELLVSTDRGRTWGVAARALPPVHAIAVRE